MSLWKTVSYKEYRSGAWLADKSVPHWSEVVIENMQRKTPPVLELQQQTHYQESQESALRKFIALADDNVLILAARRTPPVPTPTPNSDKSLSIYTSVGFQQLPSEEYAEIGAKLRPDVIVGLGDITYSDKLGRRRIDKMSARTERWTKQIWEAKQRKLRDYPAIFAPILPIEHERQSIYLSVLAEDLVYDLSGLAFYNADSISCIPSSMQNLPRLSLTNVPTPNALLREIGLGIDIFTIPFIGAATDAGAALDFRFPSPSIDCKKLALAIDMWPKEHATDLSPLSDGCTCYACAKHHRAYIQHLLNAKEMLAWNLLQIHNLHVMDLFFAGVRASIAAGTFEENVQQFTRSYESDLPAMTGKGPRVRGYQYKSEGPSETRRNPLAFEHFESSNRVETQAEVRAVDTEAEPAATDARELEEHGLGTKT